MDSAQITSLIFPSFHPALYSLEYVKYLAGPKLVYAGILWSKKCNIYLRYA